MSGLVNRLTHEIPKDAFTKKCAKAGCEVPLTGTPSHKKVIDMDHPSLKIQGSTRCDFLFLCGEHDDSDLVVPLELKSGSPRASEVIDQLQGGVNFVRDRVCKDDRIKLVPVLARGGRMHRRQLKVLSGKRILFRGRKHRIKIIRCGAHLWKLFSSN